MTMIVVEADGTTRPSKEGPPEMIRVFGWEIYD